HTDEYFVNVARELVKLGVDGIVLKDAGGLLTPDRIASLLPAIQEAIGQLPVRCHSHCVTGMGPATNIEALKVGAAAIWTCTTPLANGASLPSDHSMARSMEWLGYDPSIDVEALERVAEHFAAVARFHGKPVGRPAEY